MSRYGYRRGGGIENPKLRPKLDRAPRAAYGAPYYYYPSVMTCIEDLDRGARVTLIEVPQTKGDKTVKVRADDGIEYRVFWTDLRR